MSEAISVEQLSETFAAYDQQKRQPEPLEPQREEGSAPEEAPAPQAREADPDPEAFERHPEREERFEAAEQRAYKPEPEDDEDDTVDPRLEQARAELERQRDEYLNRTKEIADVLGQRVQSEAERFAKDFADVIKGETTLAHLFQNDPFRYQEFQARRDDLQLATQRHQTLEVQRYQEFKKVESEKFFTMRPDLAGDDRVSVAKRAALKKFALENMSPEEYAHLDARALDMVAKAAKGEGVFEKFERPTAASRKRTRAPRVQSPGAALPAVRQGGALRQAQARFNQTKSVEDLAALFAAEDRAGRR